VTKSGAGNWFVGPDYRLPGLWRVAQQAGGPLVVVVIASELAVGGIRIRHHWYFSVAVQQIP
jgi:hypothetical protein